MRHPATLTEEKPYPGGNARVLTVTVALPEARWFPPAR
jgi:hypothetical protein